MPGPLHATSGLDAAHLFPLLDECRRPRNAPRARFRRIAGIDGQTNSRTPRLLRPSRPCANRARPVLEAFALLKLQPVRVVRTLSSGETQCQEFSLTTPVKRGDGLTERSPSVSRSVRRRDDRGLLAGARSLAAAPRGSRRPPAPRAARRRTSSSSRSTRRAPTTSAPGAIATPQRRTSTRSRRAAPVSRAATARRRSPCRRTPRSSPGSIRRVTACATTAPSRSRRRRRRWPSGCAARGYDTAAVVSAVVLARRHGLDQGFRIYDDDLGAGLRRRHRGRRSARPNATTDAALAALAGLRPPFFLWVHYYDPHEEYRPPTRFADAAKGPHRLYDGEIAYMDDEIGRLLAALPPTTVVAVVGDHGEMLGEHGEISHGLLLVRRRRGACRCLLAGPGRARRRRSRTAWCAPPTSRRRCSRSPARPPLERLDGASLLPLDAPGGAATGSPTARASCRSIAYKWYPLRTLSDGRALYLEAPTAEPLPPRRRSGGVARPRAAEPAAAALWAERLERLLRSVGRERSSQVAAPSTCSTTSSSPQLASLGYLGAAAAAAARCRASCPTRAPASASRRRSMRAAEKVQQGRCAEVLPRARRDRASEDPHNFPALSLAGPVPARRRPGCRRARPLRARREGESGLGGAGGQRRRLPPPARPRRGGRARVPPRAGARSDAGRRGGEPRAPRAGARRRRGSAGDCSTPPSPPAAATRSSILERGTDAGAVTGRIEEALRRLPRGGRAAIRPIPRRSRTPRGAAFRSAGCASPRLIYESLARLAAVARRRLEDARRALPRARRRRRRRPHGPRGAPPRERSGGAREARGDARGGVIETGGRVPSLREAPASRSASASERARWGE